MRNYNSRDGASRVLKRICGLCLSWCFPVHFGAALFISCILEEHLLNKVENPEIKSISYGKKEKKVHWLKQRVMPEAELLTGNFAGYAFIIHYLPPLNLKVFNSFFKYILISAHNCTEPNR